MSLQRAIRRPSHRQTPSPNSGKVLAKSWRSPGENHSKHSEQPKRMKSQLRCGGLASASSIHQPLRANVLDTYPLIPICSERFTLSLPLPPASQGRRITTRYNHLKTMEATFCALGALFSRSWRSKRRQFAPLNCILPANKRT